MVKLTKSTVDALSARDLDYIAWDDAIKGFGARFWPSGKGTFIFKHRVGGGRAGTARKPTFGTYGAVTVGDAAGFNLQMIGAMLGHANTQTTERYSHLGADPVRQATEAVAGQIAAAMNGDGAEVVEIRKGR